MLTLIDRVTRFHAKREGKVASPAAREMLLRPEYRYANASHRDPLPEYYDDAQAQRLIDYLTNTDGTTLPASRMQWKALRDQTAVALMLGGGLTPGDVRALKTAGVFVSGGPHPNIPWKLALPGNGNAPARETPLADWAGRQLGRWLSVRSEQGIAGEFVFPSTLTGKPLSHTSCYEACKRVLAEAGFESDTGGVFKLRHTFALRQLSNGKSERDVAQWLGLLDLNSIAKYRRIVPRHVDLV
jgi:integrase